MTSARTPLFLMANLGAEVSRIISFTDKNERMRIEDALRRAERIIVEIKQFPEMQKRTQEINALSQAIADIASSAPTLAIDPEHLESYFHPFATRLLKEAHK